jgi:hypothetical protein
LEFEDLLAEALNGAAVLGSQAIRFSNTAWVVSNFNFVAAGASTTLRFSDTTGAVDPGLGGGTNWALDAVSVVQTGGPPGVPEPASLAPVALVLAALAARRRARNSD